MFRLDELSDEVATVTFRVIDNTGGSVRCSQPVTSLKNVVLSNGVVNANLLWRERGCNSIDNTTYQLRLTLPKSWERTCRFTWDETPDCSTSVVVENGIPRFTKTTGDQCGDAKTAPQKLKASCERDIFVSRDGYNGLGDPSGSLQKFRVPMSSDFRDKAQDCTVVIREVNDASYDNLIAVMDAFVKETGSAPILDLPDPIALRDDLADEPESAMRPPTLEDLVKPQPLPEKADQKDRLKHAPVITISNGDVRLNKMPVTNVKDSALYPRLTAALKAHDERGTTIIIQADEDVPASIVMALMKAARSEGFTDPLFAVKVQ